MTSASSFPPSASSHRAMSAVGSSMLFLALLFRASLASAVDDVDLHDLNWYVHVDLVTVTEDLAYWENLLSEQIEMANGLVEGGQGPADSVCCSRLAGSASVTTFGSPGDGYDVIDTDVEQNGINGFGGSGSNAYLVDSISYCGGVFPTSVGCATLPACSGNGNDDPNLWMIVTVDSFDSKTLPAVIAHERGHNACLVHTSANACQIMQGTITNPGQGGCFTTTECSNFGDARTTTTSGLECACHASSGVIEVDDTVCPDFPSGICSGGRCGDVFGNAGVKLMASAHPGSAGIPAPDDAVVISGLTGHWSSIGQISPTAEDIHGLAFAKDANKLYGVVPTTGDDSIVTIDPFTGDLIATVGTIANGTAELISMAYDPGATSSNVDDRLIMIEVAGATANVVWIDPASPSVRNQYGFLGVGPAAEFKGLAYDSNQNKLFASTLIGPNGLYEIDLTSCPPSPCDASQVPGADGFFLSNASLAFAPQTGMLYQLGTAFSNTRVFFRVIDPVTGSTVQTLSLDEMTPGGLASVPLPEPAMAPGLLLGCAGILWAGRRRRCTLPTGRSQM